MKVLVLGSDTRIFEKGSSVRTRVLDYGTLFEQLHIVVFSRRSEHLKVEHIAENIWVYPTNSRARFLYLFDFLRVVRQHVVFAHTLVADIVSAQDPAEMGLVAYIVSRRYRRKLHLQIHTDIFSTYYGAHTFRHRVGQWLAWFLVPRADGIRVVSEKIRDDILKRWPRLAERIRVLPIFTDVVFLKNTKSSFDLHDRYPKFTFIILSVARFAAEKNYLFMLDVFAEIVKRYYRAGLVLVGEGPFQSHIEKYAMEHHVFANIVIEPWQEDLVSHYKTANLFLATSLYEGHGRTIVEAAAAGIPFVTSDVGVAASLAPDQKKLVVCPINDKTCFVEKIMHFMSNQETRLRYKLNVRDDILKEISGSKEEYLEAYKHDLTETFYFGEKT